MEKTTDLWQVTGKIYLFDVDNLHIFNVLFQNS